MKAPSTQQWSATARIAAARAICFDSCRALSSRFDRPGDALAIYTFNKHVIKHHFCPKCGCAPFGLGASRGTEMAAINVRCLEGVELGSIKRQFVDGPFVLAMNEHLISDLSRFVDERGVTMSQTGGHVSTEHRSSRSVPVRSDSEIGAGVVGGSKQAPLQRKRWWIGATTPATTPSETEQKLSEDMRTDVVRFIENVVARPLRVAENGCILQWHSGGDWFQAVPLVPNPKQALRGAARKPTRVSS